MIVVADASPLISFAILKELALLTNIFADIYMPEAVFHEVISPAKPYASELQTFASTKVKAVQNRIAVTTLRTEIDLGEAEAIVLALETNVSRILIDDQKGRRIARVNGLTPIGTVGILLQAKKIGLIAGLKPCLERLIANKIRISPSLYKRVIEIAGEDK